MLSRTSPATGCTRVVLLAGAAAWGVGCGGGDMVEVLPPNGEPVVTSAIPPQTIAGGDYVNIGLSSHFSDPDRGALAYEATSSDPAVARVMVTGTLLTVEALSRGIADVTVTARDDRAAEVWQVVEVLGCVRVPEGVPHWWTGEWPGADIGGGLDVTLMNGADYAKGHVDSNAGEPFSFGAAFSFDGVDPIIRLPDAPHPEPGGSVLGHGVGEGAAGLRAQRGGHRQGAPRCGVVGAGHAQRPVERVHRGPEP